MSQPPETITVAVSTTSGIPGYRVTQYRGACYGLVVRSTGQGKGLGAAFKAISSGEYAPSEAGQYTRLLEGSRQRALERLMENCLALGANAVVGMRFDCTAVGSQVTEIVAYGTAVVVEPEA